MSALHDAREVKDAEAQNQEAMPRKRQRIRGTTAEADQQVQIKIRLPQSLVRRIDDVAGPGKRAATLRDLLADRARPNPAVSSAQRLTHAVARLERIESALIGNAMLATKLRAPGSTPLVTADELAAALVEVRRAADALRTAVTDDLLARIGMKRAGP
jgi:hypothetical protein